MFRRFVLFVWRVRFGWVVVLLCGAILATISIGAFITFPVIPEIFAEILYYFLIGAWICLGLLIAMFRRQLRGSAPRWDQLRIAGKVARLLITVLGTAVILAPFVWLGWKIMAR